VVFGGADEGLGSLAKEFVLEIGKRERKAVTYNDPGGKHDDSEEEGWSSKKQKSTTAGDADPTMKGEPGPADFLLKRLIEEARTQGSVFSYRQGDDDFQGQYDSDGMIVGEYLDGDDEEVQGCFPSLASWAFAINTKPINTKPVIFWNRKSLQQHQNEVVASVAKCGVAGSAGGWLGPNDPAGVVAWNNGVCTTLVQKLFLAEDEVQRIVKQDLEGKLIKFLKVAAKNKGKERADASACPVSECVLNNVRQTVSLSGLYKKDENRVLKSLLKRAGIDVAHCAVGLVAVASDDVAKQADSDVLHVQDTGKDFFRASLQGAAKVSTQAQREYQEGLLQATLLLKQGVLTQDEFEREKNVLAKSSSKKTARMDNAAPRIAGEGGAKKAKTLLAER